MWPNPVSLSLWHINSLLRLGLCACRYIDTHALRRMLPSCNPFLKQFAYDFKGKGGDRVQLDIVTSN